MKSYLFHIDAQKEQQPAPHFWQAAGSDGIFPEILDENGEFIWKRNDRFQTLKIIRNHHVLSELWSQGKQIGGNVYSEDENGNPVYDFTYINSVYAKCVEHGIKPVVELDYVPKALARPREEPLFPSGELYERASYPADWEKWRALLVKFTQNLVDTFGLEEVRTWYFEAWNEPDLCTLVPFIQQWPVADWSQFMRLYDVFVDAVTSVDDQLKVGGPGGCTPAFMMQFFQHVCLEKNYVTGKIGTRVDFISYHYYGMIGFDLESYPMESNPVAGFVHELHAVHAMMQQFPQLKDKEFHLNEWGECAQGGLAMSQYPIFDYLRNSEYSALYLVKLIGSLLGLRRRTGLNLTMLLYWGFAGEEEKQTAFAGTRSLTTYPHICKPLLTVQEMLTQVGDVEVATDAPIGARVSTYAFKRGKDLQVVAYNFDETRFEERYEPAPLTLKIEGLAPGNYTVTVYSLGREKNNTYAVYKKFRDAGDVSDEQLREVQKANEWKPDRCQCVRIEGTYTLDDLLPDNEMRLYLFQKTE